jgi:hypothetical protein
MSGIEYQPQNSHALQLGGAFFHYANSFKTSASPHWKISQVPVESCLVQAKQRANVQDNPDLYRVKIESERHQNFGKNC